MTHSPQHLCVLADRYLMANEARTLQRAVEQTGIEVPLVLVHDDPDPTLDPDDEARAVNGGLGLHTLTIARDVLAQQRAWSLVLAEKKLAEVFGSEAASTGRVPVESVPCLQDSEFRRVEPRRDGNWQEFPADVVEEVGNRCDLGLRFGFGLLRGDILTAPEYGVLSFHPADIREYRGLGVPQAYLDGRDRMGVTLQRLSEDIDGGEIVAYEECDVSDCRTLWETYDRLYDVKADLLGVGIERLRDPDIEPMVPESLGPYYSIEKRHTLGFSLRTLATNLRGHAGQLREGVSKRFQSGVDTNLQDRIDPRPGGSDD